MTEARYTLRGHPGLLAAMLMATAMGCSLAPEEGEEARGEQSELTPDESMTTEEKGSASDVELAAGALDSAEGSADADEITPQVACRRVTAASIPVYGSPTGNDVLCRFFRGDRFSYFAISEPPTRFITWCPRGVPPSQGTTGFAQVAGTVAC